MCAFLVPAGCPTMAGAGQDTKVPNWSQPGALRAHTRPTTRTWEQLHNNSWHLSYSLNISFYSSYTGADKGANRRTGK